jgi:hypothetical protein
VNRFGHRELGNHLTEQEAAKMRNKFLDDHNYKSYYTRMWKDEQGNTWYDVGSHTEFFVWGFMK